MRNSDLLNLIFLLLALLGLFFAYYFYKKAKREKKPLYDCKTTSILKYDLKSISKLNIYYDDYKLSNLSITKVGFWNAGSETIRDIDIVPTDPIIIALNEKLKMYDFIIDYQDERNNFKISRNSDSSLIISFDYLDQNEGLILSIYHSEQDEIEKSISFKGTIIGAGNIMRPWSNDLDYRFSNSSVIKLFQNLQENSNPIYKGLAVILVLLLIPVIILLIPLTIFKKIGNFIENSNSSKNNFHKRL